MRINLSMEKLSKNFNREEFACKGNNCCGHSAAIQPELINGLQQLRDKAGPLVITSGFRCNRHNKNVGGAENSMHTFGMAADIKSSILTPKELAALAKDIPVFNSGGIGVYKSWIHVDVRTTGKARWEG